jgi:ankyrin repeat protein
MDTPKPIALPEKPDLRHLKDQAKDLLRRGEVPTLSMAQLMLARRYGFASWTKLKAHVESLQDIGRLKQAIDREDFAEVKRLMSADPSLHRAPIGYGKDGPLTWVAECRIPGDPPSETRLAIARWMLENGSDVHQGGDGPLMRAALRDERIPMMELLLRHGANVNAAWHGDYPILCAPCECLAPRVLEWLLAHGADPHQASSRYGTPLSMVVGTYSRDAQGKAACLEVFADAGFALPDTPVMALHRGRIDLLAEHLRRDPGVVDRRFTLEGIYPPELGCRSSDGMGTTPVAGATLLHLAMEFDDVGTGRWLLEHGASPNAKAPIDAEGFGGHTPLFHAVVTLGDRSDAKARLLLDRGADANARATLRKQLRDMGDPEKERLEVFREVTPLRYARRYVEQRWVSESAVALLRERGGVE